MPNLVEVNYGRTGKSTNTDALGMREMQVRAFAARDAQYLLVKAPPTSGKSRAWSILDKEEITMSRLMGNRRSNCVAKLRDKII